MKLGKIPTLVNGGNDINCVGFSSNIEKVRRVPAVIWGTIIHWIPTVKAASGVVVTNYSLQHCVSYGTHAQLNAFLMWKDQSAEPSI